MFKLAKRYLKVSVFPIILIVVLLVCQAYGDLSLPAYTSDIVNTGIQAGGIEDCVPESVSADKFNKLMSLVSDDSGSKEITVPKKLKKKDFSRILLFVPKENLEEVKNSYVLKNGTYELSFDTVQSTLNSIMQKPLAMYFLFDVFLSNEAFTKELEKEVAPEMQDMPAGIRNIMSNIDFSDSESIWKFFKNLPQSMREEFLDEFSSESGTDESMYELLAYIFNRNNNKDFGIKTELNEVQAYVKNSYVYNKEKCSYVLKDNLEKEQREKLENLLITPIFVDYMVNMSKDNKDAFEEFKDSSSSFSFDMKGISDISELSEGLTKEQQQALISAIGLSDNPTVYEIMEILPNSFKANLSGEIKDSMGQMFDTMSVQCCKEWIKSEYVSQGIDTGKIQMRYLFKEGGKMLLLALIIMISGILTALLAGRVAARFGRDSRREIFDKVMSFSNTEFDKFSTSSLITRSTNDIQQCQFVMVMLLRMVLYAPIVGIGAVLKVLQTNASMSWIIGAAILLIIVVVVLMFIFVMPKFVKMQSLIDRLNLVTREILTGLPVIRAFSTERHEEKRFEKANIDFTKANLFVNRTMALMMPLMTLLMTGVSVVIVWVGAHGIDEGTLQVGDLLAYIQYTVQILISFVMISMISIMLPRASVAGRRIYDVVTTTPVVRDKKQVIAPAQEKKGLVEFEGVCFSYPGAENMVLEDITFTANPGETTAIIGGTGSGKSTVINLIPRFFDVSDGSVKVDGVDVRDMSQKTLRDLIGYVPQKGRLFYGTIGSNLRLGNETATDEQVENAAKIAQVMDFIDAKEERLESPISQGGTNVSGGQKQRLSIARAIVKNPEIYIFDDSFSALDFKTDSALRAELGKYTGDSTVIIVAQRISTIMNADKIIVLDDGKIAGIGTHRQLLNDCEVYRQIALSQLSKEELANE